jgi:hypothetical protein
MTLTIEQIQTIRQGICHLYTTSTAAKRFNRSGMIFAPWLKAGPICQK